MRLDFNVLWVDDQPDRVQSQIKGIALRMADHGFEFNPTQCTTMDQVEAAISEHVFTDEIDLILVDWDLGNNMHGEDAIDRIRQIILYKDVVFYSGEATVKDLQQKAFNKGLEGIYCASRQELIDEVVGVFESLIKKVLDIDHMRGIVMGATSDIDHMVKTCLTLAHDKLDKDGRAKFIAQALTRVEDQANNIASQVDKLRAAPSIETLFKAHMLFTSDHRLRMLAKILRMTEFAAYSFGLETIKSYRDGGVLRNRNDLGHKILVPHGKPNSVEDDTGNVIEIDQMRELRKLILNLRADFRALLNKMQA